MEEYHDFSNCDGCSVQCDYEKASTTFHQQYYPYSTLPTPTICHVNFVLSCRPICGVFLLRQNSRIAEYLRSYEQPMITSFVRVTLGDFLQYEPADQAILGSLAEWPIRECCRDALISYVMAKAREACTRMPMKHNSVTIEVKVTARHEHLYNEESHDELDSTMQESIDEYAPSMVPAADSAIESLEKIFVNGGSCSICLEDFTSNGEWESATCIPWCRHTFHQDCIGKWLRTSHYCPNCRFEMPTTS